MSYCDDDRCNAQEHECSYRDALEVEREKLRERIADLSQVLIDHFITLPLERPNAKTTRSE
jgi:hypothetical protein